MTELLTEEQKAERYCLQECDKTCGELRGVCLQPPGHLHPHKHSYYNYSGDGSHTWARVVPSKRDIRAMLTNSATGGFISVERATDLIEEYLRASLPDRGKKPWWRRAR